MLFVLSYTRSLMAAGLALLAVICAGLWFHNRTIALNELTATTHNLQMQIANGEAYPAMITDYVTRLEGLRTDTGKLAGKFAGRDYEAPMLVRAIVEAASRAGLEMTNASKQGKKSKVLAAQGKGLAIEVLSYAVTLKGSYTALVKFLQNLAAWNIGHKIESMDVTPDQDNSSKDNVEVALVLSVFLLDQPTEAKAGN